MNRRQKIIVSVVGIFIVLLALVGLTYGYFLTRIQGNTNTNSISVTTANLELTYGDGTTEILTKNGLMPGEVIGTKDFTVTNSGDDSEYVVTLENILVQYATTSGEQTEGEETSLVNKNDFIMTLTCTKSNGKSCNGFTDVNFPSTDSIIVGNKIESGDTHSYELTLEYLYKNSDQSDDMNKTISARVNIDDIKNINPYKENKTSLAYNIINNSMLNSNGTKLMAVGPTVVGAKRSADNWEEGIEEDYHIFMNNLIYLSPNENELYTCYEEETCDSLDTVTPITSETTCNDLVNNYVFDDVRYEEYYVTKCTNDGQPLIGTKKYEKVLSTSLDDYGTSYYYRGNVSDNYVNFNGMCWRIVRIEGDGSIKLVLEDQYTTCNDFETEETEAIYTGNYNVGITEYGYNYDYVTNSKGETATEKTYITDYEYGTSKSGNVLRLKLKEWLATSGIDTNKLKEDEWCLGNKTDLYDANGVLLTDNKNDLIYKSAAPFYYKSFIRLSGKGVTAHATYKCNDINDEVYESKIGALTADEVVFAGESNQGLDADMNYYLQNDYIYLSDEDSSNIKGGFFLLTPGGYTPGIFNSEWVYTINRWGYLDTDAHESFHYLNSSGRGIRPAITLLSGTNISGGDGTQISPYEIN